ncbi:ArnT family glycosyltransferase [Terriglobus roseus]|nr:glycosyltransferase family 39 protein [Terriglobus roseus]
MTRTTIVRPTDASLRSAVRLALLFFAIKLLIHIAATLWQRHIGMGYFRDEFYYLMCGRHLAWGYVDHGPIVALQARIAETVFGHSLLGIRILSAAAGAMRVFLTGLLCWSLGGKRSAQALAMAAVLSVPLFLGIDGFLSMNSFESMFWMPCLLALIMIFRDEADGIDRRWMWWSLLGVSAGVGLLNKPSMLFFLISVGIALLLTPQRRVLFTRHAAFGIGLLILIALPNVLWQVHNHWPTLEFLRNGREQGKNIRLSPLAFVLNQIVVIGPWGAFVWLPGLVHLLRRQDRRWLGLTFLILLVVMIALGAKDYYFAPIYPILFAAGGVAWQTRFAQRKSVQRDSPLAFAVGIVTMIVGAAIVYPSAAPVLQPQTYWRYAKALHLPDTETENSARAPLPQFFADRYGWQENVDEVTRIVNALSPADRAKVGIFCGNYGQAASLEWLGHGLPTVISEHNTYWLWGTRGLDGEVMIIDRKSSVANIQKYYEEVQVVGRVDNPLSMPYERHDIYLARHRKMPLPPDWAESKIYY